MHTPPRQEFFIFLKRLRLVEIFLVYRYRNREFGNREWVWNGDRGERWKTLILRCSVISFVKWVLEVFSSRELRWRFWGFFMCVCVCVHTVQYFSFKPPIVLHLCRCVFVQNSVWWSSPPSPFEQPLLWVIKAMPGSEWFPYMSWRVMHSQSSLCPKSNVPALFFFSPIICPASLKTNQKFAS